MDLVLHQLQKYRFEVKIMVRHYTLFDIVKMIYEALYKNLIKFIKIKVINYLKTPIICFANYIFKCIAFLLIFAFVLQIIK